jgi:hypothetical protein
MNQADWARWLRVLGMASEASARRSMEAWAKISRDFSSAAKGGRRSPQARRRSSTEAGVLAWREGSALIVLAPVVDLAVEVEIGWFGHSSGGGLMPNFHAIHENGIEAQFDLEGAQREVHLEDF